MSAAGEERDLVALGMEQCFREANKRLALSRFSLPLITEIKTALGKGLACWSYQADGEVGACAIFRQLSKPMVRKDWAGRECRFPAGMTFVQHFAATERDAGFKLLSNFVQRCGMLAFEIFQENQLAVELLGSLHQVLVATKVEASSELKSFYINPTWALALAFPQEDPAETATLECLAEAFITEEERLEILGEVENLAGYFAQHYSSYNKRKSWEAFALRGFDPMDPGFIIKPAEMSKAWKGLHPTLLDAECQPTVLMARCPATMRVLGRLPGRGCERVRFMRVAAAGGLSRHADITNRDAGVQDGRLARLHIPIKTHPAVRFHAWDPKGRRLDHYLAQGGLFYLDQRKPHAVDNGSEAERIHLVIDVESNADLRGMIAAAYRERSRL